MHASRIQIRHDDVIRYQRIKYEECLADPIPGVPCKRNNNPCELVLYQSLNRTHTWGGAGLDNMRTDDQKLLDGWDADYKNCTDHGGSHEDCLQYKNDKMEYPKYAHPNIPSTHACGVFWTLTPAARRCSRNELYNGTIIPDPPPYAQASRDSLEPNNCPLSSGLTHLLSHVSC